MTPDAPTPEEVFGLGTIPDALERAGASPHGIAFVDRNLSRQDLSYARLAEAACRVASALRGAGVEPGDRVCLLSPTTPDLLAVLFGVWRAGAAPVLLPLPRRQTDLPAYLEDVQARLDASGARLVAVSERVLSQGLPVPGACTLEDLPARGRPFPEPVRSGPDDLALLQFTSGTTARSRAVALTHRQILSNLAAAGTVAEVDGDRDVFVSWLPLFHDMGLIGMVLGAVAYRVRLVLEPTEEFLSRPGSWLDAISAFGGTLTASPNFGYGLAARDLANRPRPLDLASWRVAANGAEPIDPDTIRTFTAAASPLGFRAEAMCPMYGLAEATLAVTVAPADRPPVVQWVDREPLETSGEVVPAAPTAPGARPLVCCGHPLPGTELAILGGDGRPLPPGRVGEIAVRGPSVMSGYWQDPQATAEVLGDGWLRTGDLGFLGEEGLVVCGRLKDVIILGGRNLYPEDYEFWTERVPGVRRGNVVAFALPELERMVVVAETTVPPEEAQLVARETLETLRRRLPRGPEEVVLVPPGTLPKTSSGKRQRGACRERYASGQLDPLAVARR